MKERTKQPFDLLESMKEDIVHIWYGAGVWTIKRFDCESVSAKTFKEAVRKAYEAKPVRKVHV